MAQNEAEDVVFAGPDSPNLSCDLDGMTVKSVVSYDGNEVIVVLVGGSGMISVDGEAKQLDNIAEFELFGGFTPHPENNRIISMMADVLEEWRSNGTSLRLLSAPGAMTCLVEDAENWLPIPCGTVGT